MWSPDLYFFSSKSASADSFSAENLEILSERTGYLDLTLRNNGVSCTIAIPMEGQSVSRKLSVRLSEYKSTSKLLHVA